tara:strand:+ start:2389 stop:3087 length:699 start_codon:yes stop_codon:yes gene_type:complete
MSKNKKILTNLDSKDVTLVNFNDEKGNFSWDIYKKSQQKMSYRKIHNAGPHRKKMEILGKHIKNNITDYKFGICHGTRNGIEQKHLRDILGIEVIGTEIADGCEKFPHQIQWDFHDVKDEWIGNVDFIFSNSLDHSYDPVYCLSQWIKCMKDGGIIYLQHDNGIEDIHRKYSSDSGKKLPKYNADCFFTTIDGYRKIVKQASNDKWIIELPESLYFKGNNNTRYFIIKKREN